jgi:arylsulfatase A-like enzyme
LPAAHAAGKQPNILLLLADDMGYGELGSYGQKLIKTPHLDALAAKGLRFTSFYAGSSVCSPSRAVLMTGIPVGRATIRGNSGVDPATGKWGMRVALPKTELTVAELLRSAGYQTAMFGKWHLDASDDVSTWAFNRGFDYAIQEQWGRKAEGGEFDERDHWINGQQASVRYDYTAHACLDEFRTGLALKFLDEHRNREKPLFLYMSYRSPHANEQKLRANQLYGESGWPELERKYASRITLLDEQVQRLLDKLESMGELDNTLVIFTSDNGPHRERGHDHLFFNSAAGLRGIKRDTYEGGIRVPCIAYWKGKTAPGRVTDFRTGFSDVMPTLAEIAGVPAPAQTEGVSFLPALLGKTVPAPHEHQYWEVLDGPLPKFYRRAAISDNWKAVRYGVPGETELYDLTTDVNETTDVAAAHPDIVARMDKIMTQESTKNAHYPYSGSAAPGARSVNTPITPPSP